VLRISSFVPPAPLLAARERGLLDGIELRESRTRSSGAQLEGLQAGELDAVVTAIDNLFEWTRAGVDLRLVGQVEATTPLSIHADPRIRDLPGLEGRRFAVDVLANGFALVARRILRSAGVAVDWIEVGGVRERAKALFAGEVAATLLGPPFDAQADAAGFPVLLRVQDVFPAFPGQGLIVRADVLDSGRLDGVLAAARLCGLLPVDPAGLDVLTAIRAELGLMPPNVDLHALCAAE